MTSKMVNFKAIGMEIEILFGGHERGRRLEREISLLEVVSFIEMAEDEILDLKFNQEFAVVSACKTRAIIGVFKNNRGNMCIDVITVLNTYGTRDVYIREDTKVIYLSDII